MSDCVTSTFSEPEDFEAAMRAEGCLSMLITARGRFQARLTRISLGEMSLSAAEEKLPRIAFVAAPSNTVLMLFSIGKATTPVCGGIAINSGEFVALRPGTRCHARAGDACRWGMIFLQADQLINYGAALTGAAFSLSHLAKSWRPRYLAGNNLRSLHAAALRMAAKCPQILRSTDAAHGLQQQLLHAVVECLSEGSANAEIPANCLDQRTMVRFEQLLQSEQSKEASIAEICAVLNVSDRHLRRLCAQHLGMSPRSYDRLRRMSLARRHLRRSGPGSIAVSAVARLYGFRDPGRFAINYRARFGESPSETLRGAARFGRITEL
jgi:AraC-like DNA-binding protein